MPKDALHRAVAARIRDLAERRKLSLNKLADFSNISRSHLARILNGESSPSLVVIARIASALEVDARDLLPSTK